VAGFFSTYERHEVPLEHLGEYDHVMEKWGAKLRELGLVDDEDDSAA
jgi:hypothetical protein